ncbi:hypothetical protein [Brevundimonas sp.]|uniref:hypothetical protein n=1 Tax=Brevundimonas sp. TaxID=1871086 RepID=UPI0025BEB12B|nr:hypothetical protein [Brevundimonas sp.]
MTPTLIALALVVVAVAVIAWVTHRKTRGDATRIDSDQDTAWNDPVHPAPPHEKRPPR